MHYIYCYENKINGKLYIGQTIDLIGRDKEHIYSKDNMPIDYAIKKYGRDSFDYFTIEIIYTEDQANQSEKYWIRYLREQLGRRQLYNVADGGQGGATRTGQKHSEESKRKMSEANMGRQFSLEHRKNLSEAKKISSIGEGNSFFGKTHSEQTKQKMSLIKKENGHVAGEKNPKAKLTWEDVNEIREKYATDQYTQAQLAKEYNVKSGAVRRIVNYKTWKI